eukprot:6199379-Pleurochrysis_carterae.AAC.2
MGNRHEASPVEVERFSSVDFGANTRQCSDEMLQSCGHLCPFEHACLTSCRASLVERTRESSFGQGNQLEKCSSQLEHGRLWESESALRVTRRGRASPTHARRAGDGDGDGVGLQRAGERGSDGAESSIL